MNCDDDDDGHVGNRVIMLPGNQEVISQCCQFSCPPSPQTGWGLHFRYFTSAVPIISCVNYDKVKSSLGGAKAEEVKAKMNKSCCRGRKEKRGQHWKIQGEKRGRYL